MTVLSPDHAAGWMQHNISKIGDTPLKDYMLLPGTHDSGMDHSSWSTFHGTKNRTLNQAFGIGDQLRLGARWFDLRPMLLDGEWYAGHGSHVAVGWQGATGVKLSEAISEINEFLDKYPELVVLQVSHIQDARSGDGLSVEKHKNLISLLFKGLKHIYIGQGGKAESNLQEKSLNYFIGNKVGKVIVTSAIPIDGPDFHSAAYDTVPGSKTSFKVSIQSINAEVSWAESFLNSKSIIDLANKRQIDEWPYTPQRMWAEERGGDCGVLQIDYLHDEALITICVAMTLARHMVLKPSGYNNLVLIYGGREVTDPGLKQNVVNSIKACDKFQVGSGVMFGGYDPWPMLRKSAVACFLETKPGSNDPFLRCRFAWENDHLDFTTDIERVNFGGRDLVGSPFRVSYQNIFRMLWAQDPITPDEKFFGCGGSADPRPGEVKDALVYYRSMDGKVLKQRRIREHIEINFHADILRLEWDGVTITKPECYEPFLYRFDYGGGKLKINIDMFDKLDPSPGKEKKAALLHRFKRHGPHQVWIEKEYHDWYIPKA
ncbi:hypothetical protein TWF506_009904 [Arthrobotrys conoides]|uniref:Uncharacterized protein n=1 Tax=Arthrobotrys conoides TaxID=74498 RepID=A0AAN8RWG7_9PEZI